MIQLKLLKMQKMLKIRTRKYLSINTKPHFAFISDAITKSTPFFILSGLILLTSYIVLMLALCSEKHTILFFFSGIFFIISGMY